MPDSPPAPAHSAASEGPEQIQALGLRLWSASLELPEGAVLAPLRSAHPPDDRDASAVNDREEAEYFADWTLRRRRIVRVSMTLGISLVAHAALLALFVRGRRHEPAVALPSAAPFVAESGRVLPAKVRGAELMEERRGLVRRARIALERRDFSLGSFLLEANAIDAREEGTSFDMEEAKRLYAGRVQRLREKLKESPPEDAVPMVFDDLSYKGIPGGRMVDTLITKSGSCEPLSHLVAAVVHDAGLKERAYLRYYGGRTAGVSHLAPILAFLDEARRPVRAHDLMLGKEAARGGTSFPATELVAIYAKAHRLLDAPAEESPFAPARSRAAGAPLNETADGGPFSLDAVPTTRTLSSGYPANQDRFVGALPLFSERALTARRDATEEPGLVSAPPPCAVFLSIAWLDPPRAETGSRSDTSVDLVRIPSKTTLDHLSSLIQMVEASEQPVGLPATLARAACLTGLYQRAGLLFSLSGQPSISKRAATASNRAHTVGRAALEELGRLGLSERMEALVALDYVTMGRSWVLIFLEGGAEHLLEYVREADLEVESGGSPVSHFRKVLPMTALLVHPDSRERAVALTELLPVKVWVDVMAELIHAHDDARPWSVIHRMAVRADPDAPEEARFVRMYRVFAQLAWRLWEAQRPADEVVAALLEEGGAASLSNEELAPIAAYYMRNASMMFAQRADAETGLERARKLLAGAGLPYDPL